MTATTATMRTAVIDHAFPPETILTPGVAVLS